MEFELTDMTREEILEEIKYYKDKLKDLRQQKKNCFGHSIGEVEIRRSINEEIEEVQDEIWDLEEKV